MKDSHTKINNEKNHDGNYDKNSKGVVQIEELENQLYQKELELKNLQKKMTNLKERFQDIQSEKKRLSKRLDELELRQIELKLKDYQKLQEDCLKVKHRNDVIKKQLNEARTDITILEDVIEDLEKRGFLDYLLKRFPESFKEYQER
jgi:chromosome segregation ATPase